jgi:hypothetical protein
MKGTIARLFGVIVKFDGGIYVYNPDGTFTEIE